MLDREHVFRRPLLVSLLAVWDAVVGAGLLLVAASLLLLTSGWSGKPVVVLLLVAAGAVHLAAAGDLWRLRPAGRPLGIVVAILGLILIPVGTAIGIVAIVVLARPGMRLLFSGRQPEEHSAGELEDLHRMRQGQGGGGVIAASAAALVLLLAFPFMAIVAAIAVPNLINAIQRGRQRRTVADLRVIAARLEIARQQQGSLPPDLAEPGGIESFLAANGDSASLPELDGWNRPFVVTLEGQSYLVASYGRDGVADEPGVERRGDNGFDRDIVVMDGEFVSWPLDMPEPPEAWSDSGGTGG